MLFSLARSTILEDGSIRLAGRIRALEWLQILAALCVFVISFRWLDLAVHDGPVQEFRRQTMGVYLLCHSLLGIAAARFFTRDVYFDAKAREVRVVDRPVFRRSTTVVAFKDIRTIFRDGPSLKVRTLEIDGRPLLSVRNQKATEDLERELLDLIRGPDTELSAARGVAG